MSHLERGLVHLARGRLREGWADYRWRFSAVPEGQSGRRHFPQPGWEGGSLGGRTVLLWGEQGIGDEMCFAGLIPDAVAEARHVVLECEPRLVPLFARSFPAAEVVPRESPPHPRTVAPDIEVQAPVADLAGRFRPTPESFPRRAGYLAADPGAVAAWHETLARFGGGLRVGIAWRGRMTAASRSTHYVALDEMAEILAVPGVAFVSLQYDGNAAELAAASRRFGVPILDPPKLDLTGDLDGTAALTAALDLVIAPATSVAVLAGALGVPVWQFVPRGGYWHHHGTGGVPWYPAMRPFYRDWREESWQPVLARIAAALRRLAAGMPAEEER